MVVAVLMGQPTCRHALRSDHTIAHLTADKGCVTSGLPDQELGKWWRPHWNVDVVNGCVLQEEAVGGCNGAVDDSCVLWLVCGGEPSSAVVAAVR